MKKKITSIDQLRGEFIFFGHDTTNMTDEEIKEGVNNVAKSIGSFGATREESEKAIKTLSK